MVVGEIAESVDLLVVGAGPGGYVAAIRAAQLGRSVVLVDREGEAGVGGICLNVGCIPSKALIEVADAAHRVSSLSQAGLTASLSIDLGQWQKHRTALVRDLTDGIRTLLRSAGVTLVEGELRFTRPSQVIVETPEGQARFFEFKDVVIATGSRPTPLSALPRDGERVLNSTDALALTAVPKSLVVVGGGYIGLELGTAFAKLGSSVTIVEADKSLLPGMDPKIVRPVMARLRDLGVTVLTNARAEGYDGQRLSVRAARDVASIPADAVVVAVGRTPNTDDLGLDRLGVKTNEHGTLVVELDRRLSRHVAAIGDVTPGPMLAHKASSEAIVAAEALSGYRSVYQPAAIPEVIFSDPEIAVAGLSEAEARAQGWDPITATFPLAASGRAATIRHQRQGFLSLVADRGTGTVLGAQCVGPHASELISEGVLAIEMGATLEDLAATIHPHPTLSEQYYEAAHMALGRPVNMLPPRLRD